MESTATLEGLRLANDKLAQALAVTAGRLEYLLGAYTWEDTARGVLEDSRDYIFAVLPELKPRVARDAKPLERVSEA